MKKILKGLLFAFVAVLGLTLASCEKPQEGHQHELKSVDTWQRDSATHWQECKGCEEYVNMAVHTYAAWQQIPGKCIEQRACTVCQYIQKRNIDHTWTDWTTQEDGSLGRSCTVCRASEGVTQYYVKGSINEWSTNADYALVLDPQTMTASITLTLAAGDELKVTLADSWDVQFNIGNVTAAEGLLDGTDNIIIKEAADYKITVSGLAGSTHTCTIEQLCVHTFDWTVQSGKTCDYDGVCSKCQATTTKVEHAYGEWVNTTGKCERTATCTGCQDVKVEAVEHTFVEGVCSNCGAYDIVEYYVKGDMNGWGNNDAYKLAYNKETDTASIVLYIDATKGFKVSDANWVNQFGLKDGQLVANDAGSGNINVETSGTYLLAVAGMSTSEKTLTITATEPTAYYVKGDMNGWACAEGFALVYDAETNSATITVQIEAGQGFKVADESWVNQFGLKDGVLVANDGGSGNITVEATGSYVITVTNLNTPEVACTIEPASAE